AGSGPAEPVGGPAAGVLVSHYLAIANGVRVADRRTRKCADVDHTPCGGPTERAHLCVGTRVAHHLPVAYRGSRGVRPARKCTQINHAPCGRPTERMDVPGAGVR